MPAGPWRWKAAGTATPAARETSPSQVMKLSNSAREAKALKPAALRRGAAFFGARRAGFGAALGFATRRAAFGAGLPFADLPRDAALAMSPAFPTAANAITLTDTRLARQSAR